MTMRPLLAAAALAALLGAPAFAQMEVTCGDFSLMDNAQQMETLAALESQAAEMDGGEPLTADQIHQKLTAECKDKVDVLIIEVLAGE